MAEPAVPVPSTDVDLGIQLNAVTNTRNELIDDAIYTLAGEGATKPTLTDGVIIIDVPAGETEEYEVKISPKVDMVVPAIILRDDTKKMLIKFYRGSGTDKVPLKSFIAPYPFYAPILLKSGRDYTLLVASRDNTVNNALIIPAIIVGTYPTDGILATITPPA